MTDGIYSERFAELTGRARVLDEQVARLAEDLHRVQTAHSGEVRIDMGAHGTPIEEMTIEEYGSLILPDALDELRTVGGAMVQRLNAALDHLQPGSQDIGEVQRRLWQRYGLSGFGIDPYEEYLESTFTTG